MWQVPIRNSVETRMERDNYSFQFHLQHRSLHITQELVGKEVFQLVCETLLNDKRGWYDLQPLAWIKVRSFYVCNDFCSQTLIFCPPQQSKIPLKILSLGERGLQDFRILWGLLWKGDGRKTVLSGRKSLPQRNVQSESDQLFFLET